MLLERIISSKYEILAEYRHQGTVFEFGDGRILIYFSIGIQNSIF